ncbi:MAG: YceI family protein [Maribacter sp.]|nr:YceI family protein [Maribacter sp.]
MNKYRIQYAFTTTLLFLWVAGLNMLHAQNRNQNVTTKISYQVDFGPVYPINGESYQMIGKVALDDKTGEISSIGFNVPLNSFNGLHSDYLAWVGNSWENPDLSFQSKSIIRKEDGQYTVDGNLEFRRRLSPVEINFMRKDTDTEIILEGSFTLNTNDFFIIAPSQNLVPTWIPFQLTLVFDKPLPEGSKQISFH